MDKWIELLCNGGGIATGVIAGIVAAFVQFLISHFEHRFLQKAKKEEQIYSFNVWKRDEIGELIKDVSEIKIPAVTETNGDVIENAYHLIMAYFERAKPLLYKKSDPVTMNSTPFVRQYDILFNKWGVLLCQKEYQTNDIRRNSREWL